MSPPLPPPPPPALYYVIGKEIFFYQANRGASQRGKEGSGGSGREGLVTTEAGSGLPGNSRRGRGGRGAGCRRGGAAVKVQTPGTYDLQVL